MVFFLPHEIHKKLPTKNPPIRGGLFFLLGNLLCGTRPRKKTIVFCSRFVDRVTK
jgi:hypothetical protein